MLGNRRCVRGADAVCDSLGGVTRAAVESCPGAADFAEELVQNGWHVTSSIQDLCHASSRTRTRRTSPMLADLTRVGYLPRVSLAPNAVRVLRRLVRYGQLLANER